MPRGSSSDPRPRSQLWLMLTSRGSVQSQHLHGVFQLCVQSSRSVQAGSIRAAGLVPSFCEIKRSMERDL